MTDRYDRQVRLWQIGRAGQEKLSAARVLIVGCGALGGGISEHLARAGVGHLRIVDRDLVEMSNLHRQVLFDEADVRQQMPKAAAAARRLSAINSQITIESVVADVSSANIEQLAGVDGSDRPVDLILDGTDNVETRYLINDVAVKHGLPWVYGACVGTEGRVMLLRPPATACLRCVFPTPPAPGEMPTCDTVGVLGPVAGLVSAYQAIAAIQCLVGDEAFLAPRMLVLDPWTGRQVSVDMAEAREAECPTCGRRTFQWLDAPSPGAASLCGRQAVQVRPRFSGQRLDLAEVARRLASSGQTDLTPFLVRCQLSDPPAITLSIFTDGRVIVHGTADPARARSLVARFVGA